MQGLTNDVTLRPRSSRVLAIGVIVIAAVTVFGLLFTGRFELFSRSAPPLVLLGFGAWVVFWRPAVRIGPADVVFVNPLRTIDITWPAVQDVRAQWSLEVVTAVGTFTAWAAPKPTRIASGISVRRDQRGLPDYAAEKQHERQVRATGDLAAFLVQQQWTEYRDGGLLGDVEGTGVAVQWHGTTIAVVAVLVALWVVALALP